MLDTISCTTPTVLFDERVIPSFQCSTSVFCSQTSKSKDAGRTPNIGFAHELKLEAAGSSLSPLNIGNHHTVLEVLIKFLLCLVVSISKHEKNRRQQNLVTLRKFPKDLFCTSSRRLTQLHLNPDYILLTAHLYTPFKVGTTVVILHEASLFSLNSFPVRIFADSLLESQFDIPYIQISVC